MGENMNVLKDMKINIKTLFSIFVWLILVLVSVMLGVDKSFLFVFSIWMIIMFDSLIDIKNRILLMAFLTTFFVFLLGGHLVYEYFGMELKHYLGYEYYVHSNIAMGVSLIFLFFGVRASEKIITRIRKDKVKTGKTIDLNIEGEEDKRRIVRGLAKTFYLATYLFYIYIVIDKASFVLKNSYYDYYVSYEYNIPFIVNAIASMTPYFLYLFLATLPSKKEVMPLIILQLIYAVASLLTGRRIDFMVVILFIVVYFIFRQYYDKGDQEWIQKKHVITAIISIPFLLVALFLYNHLRFNKPISEFAIKEMLFGFFQQQGFSSSLIRLASYNQNVLREDAYYSFFGLVKIFRKNILTKLIFNPQYDFSYLGNSIGFALKGNSLSHTLSYYTLSRYLSGSGLGSCYIAELYHDFGYLGIAIGNIVYGSIIAFMSNLWMRVKKYSIWTTAIAFSLVESFLKAPRWNFDIVFTNFLNLGMWSAFLGVFICYTFLKKQSRQVYAEGNN